MRLKKLLSILFLSGVILGTVFCAGCSGSNDSSDDNKRSEKEDDDDKEDKDDKKDKNDKKDNVTVEDLVDAYLSLFFGEVDFTADESIDLKMVYNENYGNLVAQMTGITHMTRDADNGITYQEGTTEITYSPNNFGIENETEYVESYTVDIDESTEVLYEKDTASGDWYETESEAASKEEEAKIMSSGKMSEKEDTYVLTVDCMASDMGLALEDLTGVPGDCDVKITITVDKETMQCTSLLLEFDTDDINRQLSSDEMQIETMKIKRDNVKYKNTNLSLPDELQ